MRTKKDTYFIPEIIGLVTTPSLMVTNAAFTELLNYGVRLSDDLFMALARLPENDSFPLIKSILADYSLGALNRPLFFNWENRNKFTFNEAFIQVLGYGFRISGNDLYDLGYMPKLLAKVENKVDLVVNLATAEEGEKTFVELASSMTALNTKNQKRLFEASRLFAKHFNFKDIYIKSDEARVAILVAISATKGLEKSLAELKCKPADVMRYASAKKGNITGVKLPHDVKFESLTWAERRAITNFLNGFSFEKLSESFGLNRGAWKKFFNHIHLFNQKEFKKLSVLQLSGMISLGYTEDHIKNNAFMSSGVNVYEKRLNLLKDEKVIEVLDTGNLVYRTFASRVDTALKSKNFESIFNIIGKNHNYLLRNIASVGNAIQKKDFRKFRDWVRDALGAADVGVLFSILAINVDSEYRIIDVKGDTVVQPASYPKVIQDIQQDIRLVIHERFGFPGQVHLDDDSLFNRAVPFLSKNSELDRGSRIKFDSTQYLYFLCHWVQSNKVRTDLDTSYIGFDKNWRSETVYFGNQVNSYVTHGGDITNAPAPNGATEYGRIDLKNIPPHIKYIVPVINVFCGDNFCDNETAYAGFMFSNSTSFTLNANHTRYDLTQPARANMPFVIDVDEKEILIIDYNNRNTSGITAHAELTNLPKIISASKSANRVSIGDLAEMLSGDGKHTSKIIKDNPDDIDKELNVFIEPQDLQNLFK